MSWKLMEPSRYVCRRSWCFQRKAFLKGQTWLRNKIRCKTIGRASQRRCFLSLSWVEGFKPKNTNNYQAKWWQCHHMGLFWCQWNRDIAQSGFGLLPNSLISNSHHLDGWNSQMGACNRTVTPKAQQQFLQLDKVGQHWASRNAMDYDKDWVFIKQPT